MRSGRRVWRKKAFLGSAHAGDACANVWEVEVAIEQLELISVLLWSALALNTGYSGIERRGGRHLASTSCLRADLHALNDANRLVDGGLATRTPEGRAGVTHDIQAIR